MQQEKQRKGAAQHQRGAMSAAQQGDEGATKYLLCFERYQALMKKHYHSNRRPARSLEQPLAEDAIPDRLAAALVPSERGVLEGAVGGWTGWWGGWMGGWMVGWVGCGERIVAVNCDDEHPD